MSPSYLAVVRGLRELHHLTAAGRLDSPAADAVRDAADGPWEALTELEQQRIGGLSEDLYSITDPRSAPTQEMNLRAQAWVVDVFRARQDGEWDRALELLRKWGAYLDPSLVCFMRGSIWEEAGDPATAALFFEHAWRLQPENGGYLALHLDALEQASPSEARARSRDLLEDPSRVPPQAIVRASHVLLTHGLELPAAEAARLYQGLVATLESALSRIEDGEGGRVNLSLLTETYALIGACHQLAEDYPSALRAYSKGLDADPTDETLLGVRGALLYGASDQAVADLRLAIEQHTPLLWPYFYLAHHHLISGEFDQCRTLCERGLEREGPDPARTELAEWLAIAQSQLGFPVELVHASFDRALRLDPSNERARRNLAAFEAAARPISADRYETRTSAQVRASGLSDRRLIPAA